jgi:hypothetical protein
MGSKFGPTADIIEEASLISASRALEPTTILLKKAFTRAGGKRTNRMERGSK